MPIESNEVKFKIIDFDHPKGRKSRSVRLEVVASLGADRPIQIGDVFISGWALFDYRIICTQAIHGIELAPGRQYIFKGVGPRIRMHHYAIALAQGKWKYLCNVKLDT